MRYWAFLTASRYTDDEIRAAGARINRLVDEPATDADKILALRVITGGYRPHGAQVLMWWLLGRKFRESVYLAVWEKLQRQGRIEVDL